MGKGRGTMVWGPEKPPPPSRSEDSWLTGYGSVQGDAEDPNRAGCAEVPLGQTLSSQCSVSPCMLAAFLPSVLCQARQFQMSRFAHLGQFS